MGYPDLKKKCYACGQGGNYSVVLSRTGDRLYLPNQIVRADDFPPVEEVVFCASCMRTIEDSLRATVLYLQSEHGLVPSGA